MNEGGINIIYKQILIVTNGVSCRELYAVLTPPVDNYIQFWPLLSKITVSVAPPGIVYLRLTSFIQYRGSN